MCQMCAQNSVKSVSAKALAIQQQKVTYILSCGATFVACMIDYVTLTSSQY